jgi:hypothetical protein
MKKKIPTLMDREVKKITKNIKWIILNTILFSEMLFLLIGALYDIFISVPSTRPLVNNTIIMGSSIVMLIILALHIRRLYIHLKLIYQSVLTDVNVVINALHKCDPKTVAKLTSIKITRFPNPTIH